jgi:molybdenum cofactor synthesis domain-containing protein
MTESASALVLTVSDRVSAGLREDESGPLAVDRLMAAGFEVSADVVPDDANAITKALLSAVEAGYDLVLTTGGTGLGPRDVTPEASAAVIERSAPGLADAISRSGSVPTAVLSRGHAGSAGRTLIINLAGSPGAVKESLDFLLLLLPHAIDQLRGGDH